MLSSTRISYLLSEEPLPNARLHIELLRPAFLDPNSNSRPLFSVSLLWTVVAAYRLILQFVFLSQTSTKKRTTELGGHGARF